MFASMPTSSSAFPFLRAGSKTRTDRGYVAAVRAFGARAVHIIAGNAPGVCAISLMRSFITRSDTIIKTPSTNPMTASPAHRAHDDRHGAGSPDDPPPVGRRIERAATRRSEDRLLLAEAHRKTGSPGADWRRSSTSTQYVQPGIDLITLDPKLSSTIHRPTLPSPMRRRWRGLRSEWRSDVRRPNQGSLSECPGGLYRRSGHACCQRSPARRFSELVFRGPATAAERVSTPARQLNPALAENRGHAGTQATPSP